VQGASLAWPGLAWRCRLRRTCRGLQQPLQQALARQRQQQLAPLAQLAPVGHAARGAQLVPPVGERLGQRLAQQRLQLALDVARRRGAGHLCVGRSEGGGG
jgi:hypothetical protein